MPLHRPARAAAPGTPGSKPLIQAEGFCAPERVGAFGQRGSCLTREELALVAEAYNAAPSTPAARRIRQPHRLGHGELLRELRARMPRDAPAQCSTGDHCVLDMPAVAANPDVAGRLRSAFRPQMPDDWLDNERMWLSTLDILQVMRQYAATSKTFAFLGVFPVNFSERRGSGSCVSRQLCDVPDLLRRLRAQGKTEFGAVFNLDRHDQSGSHWVALYCGLDPARRIYGPCFYDSVGKQPPPTVAELMDALKREMEKESPAAGPARRAFRRKVNRHRRQFRNTECGVFAMLFIIMCMHHGDTTKFRRICRRFRNDDEVHAYRRVLFRPPPKALAQAAPPS